MERKDKTRIRKAITAAKGHLFDIALDEKATVWMEYDICVIKDKPVPVVFQIRKRENGDVFFGEMDIDNDIPLIGEHGDRAVAKDATPQQAAMLLDAYWDAIK